jgi:uncharacterized protein
MEGEHDLAALLQNMYPEMHEGIFVFCTLADDAEIPTTLTPLLTFREAEGTTLVIRQEQAERIGLPHHFGSRLITLTVHSSLEAVGFLAAIAAGLAKAGISVTTAAWSRQNDSATVFRDPVTLWKRSMEMKPSRSFSWDSSAAPMSRQRCILPDFGQDSKITAIMCLAPQRPG